MESIDNDRKKKGRGMKYLVTGIAFAVVIYVCIFGMRQVIMSTRNHRPRMASGDKRFSEIKKTKTRAIS